MEAFENLGYVTRKKGTLKYSFSITEKGEEFLSAHPQPTPTEAGSAVQSASNPFTPRQ
jgi:hypothetical protein